MKAYCIACQKKVEMKEPITKTHTKNLRYIYVGHCLECGRRVSTIRQETE